MRRRARGDGSVFPRNGQWVAQVSVRGPDGRRKYITRWRKTKRLAELALDGLIGQVEAGADTGADARPLDEWLEGWLRDVKPTVRASTWTSYEGHVRLHISPLLGGIQLGRLRPSDVRRLIADRLQAGASPATVRRIVTTLQMALNVAVRDRVLQHSAVTGVRLPKVERLPIEPLTPDRAGQILDAVAGNPYEALYVLLLGSGMRVGEATALDWRDVDLDSHTVRIRSGKTRASVRTVPIPAFVADALRAHRARSPIVGQAEPVFRGQRKGERLRVDYVTKHFPELLERAGLPRMRAHDLRHGTATLLLAQGVPMRVISEQLGHANPAITANVYAHVIEASQRAAVEGLDRVFGTRRLSG